MSASGSGRSEAACSKLDVAAAPFGPPGQDQAVPAVAVGAQQVRVDHRDAQWRSVMPRPEQVVERGVVPDDVDHAVRPSASDARLRRRRRTHRVLGVRLGGVGHAGVVQAHRQVAEAVAGGHDDAAGQALEGHVPQPAGVGAVGDPRVDADHERASDPATRSSSSSQPAGFLASMSRARTAPNGAHGEPTRHLVDRRHGGQRFQRRRRREASAATAAISALAWLNRPGSASSDRERSARPPRRAVAVPIGRHAERRLGAGAGEAAPGHAGPRAVVRRSRCGLRRRGSPRHRAASAGPAPTQCTSRAAPAPHTTSGSSALATTCVCGAAASAARQRPATMRTSLVRSSWSRERFKQDDGWRPPWPPAPAAGRSRRPRARRGACAGPGERGDVPRRHVRPVSLLTTASPRRTERRP